jgi:alpha-amylase/alpha-mannosidase (GH57 family)
MSLFDSNRMQFHFGSTSKFDMYKNFNDTVNLTLSSMTVNDDCANLVVETDMEGATLISIQTETIVVLATTTPSLAITMEDIWVDVRIEEIEAPVMEE